NWRTSSVRSRTFRYRPIRGNRLSAESRLFQRASGAARLRRGGAVMTAEQRQRSRADERLLLEKLSTLIGERVLSQLGQPVDLHRVQVRRLWDGHYRVNILIGADAASA